MGFLRGRTWFSGGKGGGQWSSTENKGWNIEHRLQITITTNKGRGESQSNMEDQVHNQNPPPPLPFSCALGRIKVQIQGVERLTS